MDRKDKRKKGSQVKLSTFGIQVENEIPVLERIKYPIIWERITTGYRIQDLQPSKIECAIDLIKSHYITDEPLCQGVNLVSDKASVEEFINMVTYWLKDTQSLAAVEEGTGSFVGVLIGRVFDRTLRAQSRMTSFVMDTFTIDSGDKKVDNVEEVVCPPLPCRDFVRPGTGTFKRKPPKSKEDPRNSEIKPKKSVVIERKDKSIIMDRKEKSFIMERREKSFFMDRREKSIVMDRKDKSTKSLRGVSESVSGDDRSLKRKPPMFDDDYVVYESPLLMKIHRLKSHLVRKVDILNLYDALTYYSIHLLVVSPGHRGKGVARAMLRSSMDMSKKFRCDVVSGIFTDIAMQNIAHVEGFKVLEEVVLSDWLENDSIVFNEIDSGSYSANVMAIRIEDPPPPVLLPPSQPPKRRTRVH